MEQIQNPPEHVAIIMDGNRRWAKLNGYEPTYGHRVGAKTLEDISKFANNIGIKYLTVYAFSTENWKRTKKEVDLLMKLIEEYINRFVKTSNKENIRLKVLGDKTKLSDSLQKSIKEVEEKTKNADKMTLSLAINYGGRQEIVTAVKNIANKVKAGEIEINNITEESISNYLYTVNMPDPDLVIRTSNELRTSNFLPYQITYSELYFTSKNWPEFTNEDFMEAINEYNRRNRKFGGR